MLELALANNFFAAVGLKECTKMLNVKSFKQEEKKKAASAISKNDPERRFRSRLSKKLNILTVSTKQLPHLSNGQGDFMQQNTVS